MPRLKTKADKLSIATQPWFEVIVADYANPTLKESAIRTYSSAEMIFGKIR